MTNDASRPVAPRPPVRLVNPETDMRSPLVRAMDLYAHTAEDFLVPFQLIRHRKRLYALICVHSDAYGWTSRIVRRPSQCHHKWREFSLDFRTTVGVMAVSLDPGAAIIVDAVRMLPPGVRIGPHRYVFRNPKEPAR